MNHGFKQREKLKRQTTTDANTGSENDIPTGSTKPVGLSGKPTNMLSRLKPLQDKQMLQHRPILSDKSNKFTSQSLKFQKPVKESQTKVYADEKKPTIKHQDTLDQTVIEQSEKKNVQEFFTDNETRYAVEEEEQVLIVPVLPIVVPQHLKHLYRKDVIGSKRPIESVGEPSSLVPDKKLRTSISHPNQFFAPNAPPLPFDINEETIQYEKQQEKRAKLAMLQTTQALRESQWNDPMLVAEYASEIFGHLYDAEVTTMGDPFYALNQQHEVSWKMRSVLVDWVIEIHYLFGLLPETLFLAVNIIDRFLSLRTVVLGKLQLVGITALFIATKFEEMTCPSMQDFLFMTDKAVKDDELIKAERFVLQVLDFHLCYPNPLNFLRRICTEEMRCDIHTRTLAKYFMEISLVDHSFIGVRPSQIAAAALWLSKKMLAKGKWNTTLTKFSGYAPDELKSTVESMLEYLSQPVMHDAFFKKWSTKKLSKASIFVRDWINRYYIQ